MPQSSTGATARMGNSLLPDAQAVLPSEGMTDLDRTKVTFEQAEGLEPLPSQLKPRELTQHLRAGFWLVLNDELDKNTQRHTWVLHPPWKTILHGVHVFRRALPTDEFDPTTHQQKEWLKPTILQGSYDQVFGLLQWILRHQACPRSFSEDIAAVLKMNRAGYRLIDGRTFMPIASEEEAEVAARAFAALRSSDAYSGARQHLTVAADRVTASDWTGAIRESIHAVEAVVRVVTQKKKFSEAIAVFENRWSIHGALKTAFLSLYGYTSDEPGIRHPLLDAKASVDEVDALFMFGACAAFVTYLIQKSQPHPS
jgi:hypothetical protein